MNVLRALNDVGAVYEDRHFVYKSGKHGANYINMDPMFTNPTTVWELAKRLVQPFERYNFQTVIAPATGGIMLAAYAALWSGNSRAQAGRVPSRVAYTWADKSGDGFVIDRAGFTTQIKNRRVLVVEDILNTGDSVAKTCRLVEQYGGEVVGVSVVVNRGGVSAEWLDVSHLEWLASVQMDAFAPSECPLCRQCVPIVEDIGHGDRFKAAYPSYEGGYKQLLV